MTDAVFAIDAVRPLHFSKVDILALQTFDFELLLPYSARIVALAIEDPECGLIVLRGTIGLQTWFDRPLPGIVFRDLMKLRCDAPNVFPANTRVALKVRNVTKHAVPFRGQLFVVPA